MIKLKKTVTFILVVIMCLTFVSCGRSENAKAVDKKIHSLEEITIENGELFEEIETLYEQLSDEEKSSLKYTETLSEKRTQLAQDFAEKLSVVFATVSDDANNVKIHNCWYAKNPDNGNYYFTYYISTMNENNYEYWGNDESGFVNLTGKSIDEAISTSSGWHRFWGQNRMFKIHGKTALEMDYIELDADAIQDYYLSRPQ